MIPAAILWPPTDSARSTPLGTEQMTSLSHIKRDRRHCCAPHSERRQNEPRPLRLRAPLQLPVLQDPCLPGLFIDFVGLFFDCPPLQLAIHDVIFSRIAPQRCFILHRLLLNTAVEEYHTGRSRFRNYGGKEPTVFNSAQPTAGLSVTISGSAQ